MSAHLATHEYAGRQNDRHFPDNMFNRIFLNENAGVSINVSLNFVPYGPIEYKTALVQIIIIWTNDG